MKDSRRKKRCAGGEDSNPRSVPALDGVSRYLLHRPYSEEVWRPLASELIQFVSKASPRNIRSPSYHRSSFLPVSAFGELRYQESMSWGHI